MKLPNWMRHLPHPKYGDWCGAKNTHDEWMDAPPIDEGDMACMHHDFELRDATSDEKHRADARLYTAWKAFKPKTLYGKFYRRLILVTFRNKYCK